MDKKKYLIEEICKNLYNCTFKKDYRSYFLEYFPDKTDSWDINFPLKPLDPISKNDLLGVCNRLSNYYTNVEYLQQLKKHVKNIKIEKDAISSSKLSYDVDYIIYNYLKCWPNLKYFVCYGDKFDESIIEGEILVRKSILLNSREMMCLLFFGNLSDINFKTKYELEKMAEMFGYGKKRRKANIIFFNGDTGPKNIENVGLFYGGDFDSAISFAGLVFNPSNFIYFNEMLLDRFLGMDQSVGKLIFLGTRNYLVKNIQPIDLDRFLYFSSIIFYFYGFRSPNDIDITSYNEPKPKPYLESFFQYFKTDGNRLLGVGDMSIRGYGSWRKDGEKEYLENWFMKEWPQLFGAKDYMDMIFNPRYHINISGMKIITLEADIVRRERRFRPASYADLIAYNYFMPVKLKIEEPPRKYIKSHKEEYYDTAEKLKDLVKKIRKYLRYRYDITIPMTDISRELGISNKIGMRSRSAQLEDVVVRRVISLRKLRSRS